MVGAIRQTLTVETDGRIEIRSPEFRPGARAEVIVFLDPVASAPTAAADPPANPSIAALEELQRKLHLNAMSADAWVRQVNDERASTVPRVMGSEER